MTKLLYIFLIPWSLFAYASQAQAYANFPLDSTLEVFSKKGKKGVKNQTGSILLDPKYQDFGWSDGKKRNSTEIIGYRQNDLWGLMANDFEEVSKPKYNSIVPFGKELLIISEKSKYSKVLFYGLIRSNGKTKIKSKYRNLNPAGDFLITATKKEQEIYFGIINSNDKSIVPSEYFHISYLGYNNFSLTHENGDRELIKLTPKPESILKNIDSVSTFRDGVAIVFKNGKQGLIRQDGKILLPVEYKKIEWNNGKHIYVTQLDEWTVHDTNGKEINTHRADSVFYLNDSLIVKNTSSFAQVYNTQSEKDLQGFRADIKDVFGENYILQTPTQTFIAKDSNQLISQKFTGDVHWNKKFFVAKEKTFKGFENIIINRNGKSIVAQSYNFSEEIIELKIKSFWGIFNEDLNEIIPPMYESIKKNGEHFIVNFKGQFGVIDQENEWVIPPLYLSIEAIDDSNYKMVDKYLREYISDGIDRKEAKLYYDFYGQFGVEQNVSNQFRLIDQTGSAKTGFRSGRYNGHGENGILFKNQKQHILINQEGKELFKINNYDTIVFSNDEYLAIQRNGQWGFINQDGILRIANRYDTVRPFFNERSAIKIRNSWGFINRQEDLVIQPYFSEVSDFENNTAFVKINNKYGVIDSTGQFIIEAEYDEILKEKGFYLLRKATKWGVAKTNGKIITYPTYDSIRVGENFLTVEKYASYRIVTAGGINLINNQFDKIYFDQQQKVFLAKKTAKREQVFLTDILSGKYP
ncbi:WG repeat-containing protein [Marivirga harenae]|uniref:WG repeat-containing protein n=1 Tax=Marivirga harenae TaxID=2010992 RepID=UPI0026E08BC2|nr:WG repeat-containing protein [Marivirga harenae]WKV12747.1 WG repeat-containing protein [Marivirga harenae]